MTRPPVFVGGTGRSGTSVVAALVAAHPEYANVGAEVRFHADRLGLTDLIARRVEPDVFLQALRGPWFGDTRADGSAPGLRRVCPPERLAAAVGEFEGVVADDRIAAAGGLIRALLDPIAIESGCAAWLESTPPNMAAAAGLARIVPDALFIHCVRDGADVACSVAQQPWGPASRQEALLWWHDRFLAAARGEQAVSGRVHRVYLERLVGEARDEELDRLMEFLGLDDDPAVRRYFDQLVEPAKAHVARWSQDVPAANRRAFVLAARRATARLSDRGAAPPPTTAVSDIAPRATDHVALRLLETRWALATRAKSAQPRNRLLRAGTAAVVLAGRALERRLRGAPTADVRSRATRIT